MYFHSHTREGIGGAANIPGVIKFHRQMIISVRKIIVDIHLWMRVVQETDVLVYTNRGSNPVLSPNELVIKQEVK